MYGSRNYTEAVDLWSVGCIFGELINRTPGRSILNLNWANNLGLYIIEICRLKKIFIFYVYFILIVFPGENDIDQLGIVIRALGTPNEDIWPGVKGNRNATGRIISIHIS